MPRFIASIPKIVVSLLLVAAIINLLIGVFLRYVMIPVTDWLDVDSDSASPGSRRWAR